MNTCRRITKNQKGFTLVELMVVAALLGLLVLSFNLYLFGTKEKKILETERDQIVNSLKIAQQDARAAYMGYDYTVHFDKLNNQYTIQPENTTVTLHPDIKIDSVVPSSITFYRLTGRPGESDSLELILFSRRFKSIIQVSSEGIITAANCERR